MASDTAGSEVLGQDVGSVVDPSVAVRSTNLRRQAQSLLLPGGFGLPGVLQQRDRSARSGCRGRSRDMLGHARVALGHRNRKLGPPDAQTVLHIPYRAQLARPGDSRQTGTPSRRLSSARNASTSAASASEIVSRHRSSHHRPYGMLHGARPIALSTVSRLRLGCKVGIELDRRCCWVAPEHHQLQTRPGSASPCPATPAGRPPRG